VQSVLLLDELVAVVVDGLCAGCALLFVALAS
jgi:hypothetical protein